MSISCKDLRKPTILLVEDNKEALDNLSILLDLEGFALSTAQNGLEALEQLKRDRRICLVVLDLSMPIMNGWEFLQHKGMVGRVANVPVIVLSALPLPFPPEGVQAVIQKPVYPRILLDTIER